MQSLLIKQFMKLVCFPRSWQETDGYYLAIEGHLSTVHSLLNLKKKKKKLLRFGLFNILILLTFEISSCVMGENFKYSNK